MIVNYDQFMSESMFDSSFDRKDVDKYVRKLVNWVDSGLEIPSLEAVMNVRQISEYEDHEGKLCFRLYDIYDQQNAKFISSTLAGNMKGKARPKSKKIKPMILKMFEQYFPAWPGYIKVDWAVDSLTNDMILRTDLIEGQNQLF